MEYDAERNGDRTVTMPATTLSSLNVGAPTIAARDAARAALQELVDDLDVAVCEMEDGIAMLTEVLSGADSDVTDIVVRGLHDSLREIEVAYLSLLAATSPPLCSKRRPNRRNGPPDQ